MSNGFQLKPECSYFRPFCNFPIHPGANIGYLLCFPIESNILSPVSSSTIRHLLAHSLHPHLHPWWLLSPTHCVQLRADKSPLSHNDPQSSCLLSLLPVSDNLQSEQVRRAKRTKSTRQSWYRSNTVSTKTYVPIVHQSEDVYYA